MSPVLEEAAESAFWIELLLDAKMARVETFDPLLKEAEELIAIADASINSAKLHSVELCTSLISAVGLAANSCARTPTRRGKLSGPSC